MAEGVGGNTARAGARTVFISYASQDATVANAVVGALEYAGLSCWIAPRDVEPGARYADEIVSAINESRAVVLVLSAHSVASGPCRQGAGTRLFEESSHHRAAYRRVTPPPRVRVLPQRIAMDRGRNRRHRGCCRETRRVLASPSGIRTDSRSRHRGR